MADSNIGFDLTMGNEGGYANNPNDRGKETYKGISRVFFPNWQGWFLVDAAKKQTGVVDQLNRILANNADLQADVRKFYKLNFWDVNKLDQFTNQAIANELFDTGVNMGAKIAASFLQRSLNASNKKGKLFPNIAVDGVIGGGTLALVNAHTRPKMLLKMLNTLQGARYFDIMENNVSQEEFAESWFSRVEF